MNNRMTKKDKIVEELRTLIVNGSLQRGERIQQDEIAARFDTSVTPVREALRQLEAEGLLVGEPHRGVRVASANADDVKAVYIMRRLVEPYAFQRASRRMGHRDLEIASATIDQMARTNKRGDRIATSELNRDFHFLFYNHTGIEALTRRIEELWFAFPWDILQVLEARVDASIEEHRTILACVRAQDLKGLSRAVEDHLSRSYIALARHLEGSEVDDPFALDVD
jgi:DNA-binding GntR family transcriptional regulator